MPNRPTNNPDQETRNDDPNVQDQREQRAKGEKDQAEGERVPSRTSGDDERINPEVEPRGDRKHNAREARSPGGGRKGQPAR
jgi:hypothetical protein